MNSQGTTLFNNLARRSVPGKGRYVDSAYAAVKPTFDEFLANARRFNRASADFLKLDVQTALIFTGIALQTDDSVKRRRNQRSARKAYDSVLKLAKKVQLTDEEIQTLSRNLDRLKFELQTLGEIF